MDNNIKVKECPEEIRDDAFRFDSFSSGDVLHMKKKNHLPCMGWNSWNAFGSANTEELTKIMADKLVELELDKLGYKYVVLDDGCYKSERIDGLLQNEEVKFPSGFAKLSEYIHAKGLKFGMYNDIGTNLCAGAAVGTCGHEKEDALTYINWGVDFLKVDNCYYLWDNATFSNAENAKYVYAPAISSLTVSDGSFTKKLSAVNEGRITGEGAVKENGFVKNIGTFDGTGPDRTPVGSQSAELIFDVNVPSDGEYTLTIDYEAGREVQKGSWLQIKIADSMLYDNFVDEKKTDIEIKAFLKKGNNEIRLMNHRRQENTLCSYAALLEGLNIAKPDHDVILSICEWGKTQPQNWGYKVGDSWRILNDITFQVGSPEKAGHAAWSSDYTTSVTAQYNKCVIMDSFAGLDKGWNDPDMMMIGMEGLNETQCRTHMVMWCMMNSPLMLGMDLRNVKKGDSIWNIIADKELISLNQDALGIQAKRIYTTAPCADPSKDYIRDNERVDVLLKPLSDGAAVAVINLSENNSAKVDTNVINSILAEYKFAPIADAGELAPCESLVIKVKKC